VWLSVDLTKAGPSCQGNLYGFRWSARCLLSVLSACRKLRLRLVAMHGRVLQLHRVPSGAQSSVLAQGMSYCLWSPSQVTCPLLLECLLFEIVSASKPHRLFVYLALRCGLGFWALVGQICPGSGSTLPPCKGPWSLVTCLIYRELLLDGRLLWWSMTPRLMSHGSHISDTSDALRRSLLPPSPTAGSLVGLAPQEGIVQLPKV
jgi:hypothetical protein